MKVLIEQSEYKIRDCRYRRFIFQVILISVLNVGAFGCSAAKGPEIVRTEESARERFHVSVKNGGKPVKDFEASLVHRLSVSDVWIKRNLKGGNLPLQIKQERDRTGKSMGLRVLNIRPGDRQTLGILPNDLLTAIDTAPLREEGDLEQQLGTLPKKKELTLTLERAGRPHKIYYFTGDSIAENEASRHFSAGP